MKLNDSNLFRQKALINGEWLDANNGEVIDVTNPANGDKLGSVPKMGADETRAAIDAANRALPAWRALTAKERANILRNWFNLMMEHQDDLARLMTLEQGKPLAEAKGEISYAASFIEWFAEEGKRIYGDTIPGHQADKRLIVIKQPIGVTAAITPWNFPAAMITRKAGPALAAGCTMVLKPASQTPFSALALAELAIRAGVPAGVFNVVTGSAGAVGNELTSNPLVRKLSFTGSTEIGRQLMEQCAKDIKLLSTGAAFLTVVVNYYAPAKVFKFLIDSSGAIALLVYLVIAVSQLRMRKILRAEGSEIRLRMWLYPWLTWLVIGFITFVLVVMLFRPAQQLEVISTGLLAIGIICTVPIMARWKKLIMWQKTPIHNTR